MRLQVASSLQNIDKKISLKKLLGIQSKDYQNTGEKASIIIDQELLLSNKPIRQYDMKNQFYNSSDKYFTELIQLSLRVSEFHPQLVVTCKEGCISDSILISFIDQLTNPKFHFFDQKSRIEEDTISSSHSKPKCIAKYYFDVTKGMKLLNFIEVKNHSRITKNDCLYFYTTISNEILISDSYTNSSKIIRSDEINENIVFLTHFSMKSFFVFIWDCYLSLRSFN